MSTLLTIAELATRFGLTRRQARYAVHRFRVPYRRAGNAWLIDVDEFALMVGWGSTPKAEQRLTQEKLNNGLR